MSKRFEIFSTSLSRGKRGLTVQNLISGARRWADALCEMVPVFVSLRSGALSYEVRAKDDNLLIVFFLARTPQLQLNLDPRPALSEDAWLEEDVRRVYENLYKIQEALDREALRLQDHKDAPFVLQPTPTTRLLASLKSQKTEIHTPLGLTHTVIPPQVPLIPVQSMAPDFIRAMISSVELDYLRLEDVSYLHGTGHVSLALSARLQLPGSSERNRLAVLAEVALRSGMAVEAQVRNLVNPLTGRTCRILLDEFINEYSLVEAARKMF